MTNFYDKLRDYQREALDAAREALGGHATREVYIECDGLVVPCMEVPWVGPGVLLIKDDGSWLINLAAWFGLDAESRRLCLSAALDVGRRPRNDSAMIMQPRGWL